MATKTLEQAIRDALSGFSGQAIHESLAARKSTAEVSQAGRVLGHEGGVVGGPARARSLSPGERAAIAKMGGKARQRTIHRPGK